ncbi:site-specific integrase [Aliarcobacter cryaerophilus]|uniref:tyrosine-type recombinase/integrase n=1 Tax=Aliarcobacter cryaerophilus TaxID=28198 RepID=UPI0021B6DED8|nr:site-specific integrase [Aliarcobacter cryaerophilus]MCT7487084.1 site-specific integrase [Aliarcobacter cryaerophilus]MCT7491602.1 site-specific integrase [Aliarcobacter cryaerophilus]
MELQKNNETFSSAVQRWKIEFETRISKRRDEKTVENYINVVQQFEDFIFSDKDLDRTNFIKINHFIIEDFITYRDKKRKSETGKELAVSTKKNDLKVLKIFFEFIEDNADNGVQFFIKWKKVEVGKMPRREITYHSEDNIIRVLNYMQRSIKKERTEFAYMVSFTFKLALYGGLRATEICNLKLENFGEVYTSNSEKKKFIPITIYGKGSTVFTNPIPYEYIKNEFNFFKRNKNKKDDLFLTKTGIKLNRNHLYGYFENIGKLLGLDKKGIHIIRRTFATNLNELGVDIRNIQLLMRHSDIKTTTIYTARSQKQMEAAVGKL